MVEQFSEKCCLLFVVSKGFGAVFTSKTLLAQYRPVRLHVTVFNVHGPIIFASGSFGAVFVNLLSAFMPDYFLCIYVSCGSSMWRRVFT